MRKFRAFVLAFLVLAIWVNHVRAERVVADLTSHHISVEFDFSGATLTLFGAVEDTAKHAEGKPDIVVTIKGPKDSVRIRKKEDFAGVWINGPSKLLHNLPSYYVVISNRPVSEITDAETSRLLRFGLDDVPLSEFSGEQFDEFARAFVRLKKRRKHFAASSDGITLIGKSLFRGELRLPADVQTGEYSAKVHLLRNGKLLSQYETKFDIKKTGVESWIYNTAQEHSLVYGLLAVLTALASGLGASYIFRQA